MNLESHRDALGAVAYRITGDMRLSEDLVQEAFLRALDRPPADTTRPWRPWLIRVVANLAKDALRRRRRRSYVGPWLPTPVPTDLASAAPDPQRRLEGREVVSWASLLALEVLTPQQRAVWVLREVGELSAVEVASALGTTAGAVRAAHRRARRALDQATPREPRRLDEAMGQALQRLSMAILSDDLSSLQQVLCADVQMHTDGGGEVHAATRVVVGAERVSRMLLGLSRKNVGAQTSLARFNDRLGIEVRVPPRKGIAEHTVLLLTLAPDGRVRGIQVLAAPGKLRALYAVT